MGEAAWTLPWSELTSVQCTLKTKVYFHLMALIEIMSRSIAVNALTEASLQALQALGTSLSIAITRRKLTRRDVAQRALISEPTLRALRAMPKRVRTKESQYDF